MTVSTDHRNKTINAASLLTGGRNISAGDRAENSSVLQYWADQGFSVYFPPGAYEFSQSIKWNSQDKISVWGQGSAVYQTEPGQRLFEFDNCNGVSVRNMHMHTHFFTSRVAGSDASNEALTYANSCNEVEYLSNTYEGFACYVCFARGGRNITIKNNRFLDGVWIDGPAIQTADIRLGRDGNNVCDSVIITGNHCNTMSLLGISSQQPSKHTICSHNNVISKDNAGNPITAYRVDARKSGVELQYYTDSTQAQLTSTDDFNYEMEIDNNKISGVRFAGINCQETPTDMVHSGIRGSISGNKIRYCGLEDLDSAVSNRQGGICVNQYRDLQINDNVINNIPNDGGMNGTSAIIAGHGIERSASTGGSFSSLHVEGNIISNCASRGIYLDTAGNANIIGNTVQDITGNRYLHVVSPPGRTRAGKVVVDGNQFAGETPLTTDVVRIESNADIADYIVTDNLLDFSASTVTGQFSYLLLFGTKLTVANNRVIGNGGQSRGLNLATEQNKRMIEAMLSNNTFRNCGEGVRSIANALRGPFILLNHTFENCTTNIGSASIFNGMWTSDKAVVYGSGPPTEGNWLVGDMVFNNAIAGPAQPQGWYCSAAGAPGTWTQFGVT